MTEQQKHTLWAAVETLEEYNSELHQSNTEEMPYEDFEVVRDLRDMADTLISYFAPYMD